MLHVRRGKSKNAKRDVPLTVRVSEMLERRSHEIHSPFVFPGNGDQPLLVTSLVHMHSKVRKHSEPKTVQDEIDRHTRLGESGVDAFTIMRLAGQQCHDKPAARASEPRDGRTCIRQTGDLEQEIGRVGVQATPAQLIPATVSATVAKVVP